MAPDKKTKQAQEKVTLTDMETPAKTHLSDQSPKPQTELTDREDTLCNIEDTPQQ